MIDIKFCVIDKLGPARDRKLGMGQHDSSFLFVADALER
jgi:hypothetical protein